MREADLRGPQEQQDKTSCARFGLQSRKSCAPTWNLWLTRYCVPVILVPIKITEYLGCFMHDYVSWLRHSSPYINAHRERTFVIMLPGEGIAHANFTHILHDIVLLHSLGVRMVLVYGARPQIEARLKAAQIASNYHHALRITDARTLACVIDAAGQLRTYLEAQLSVNMAASPMQGAKLKVVSGNFVAAKPCGVIDGVDYQHTGEVRRVDAEGIQALLEQRNIVLLPHLGYSPTGEVFNLACEDVATQTAISLNADKLILFTAEQGILDEQQQLIRELKLEQAIEHAQQFAKQSNVSALQATISACQHDVSRSHIISYQIDGALLSELFTRDGCGTLVDQGHFEQVRQAGVEDIAGLAALIRPLEEQGVLVSRPQDLLAQEYAYFTVIERDGLIIACAALYPFVEEKTAELACLAVHPDYRHGGRGDTLLEHLENQAKRLNLNSLFVLTTRTAHWFQERGFEPCSIEQLPQQKAALYNYQRNSKVFRKSI